MIEKCASGAIRARRGHDDILGAALLAIDAQEFIKTVALAMRHGIEAAELPEAIYTHAGSTAAFNDALGAIVRADQPLALDGPR